MPAYLMTWNPELYPWHDFAQDLSTLTTQGYVDFDWSCGQTRRIKAGDPVWLLRLGPRPRGIFGRGYALSEPVEGPSWRDARRTQMYLSMRWHELFDTQTDRLVLPQSHLKSHPVLSHAHWSPQSSGVSLSDELNAALEQEWRAFLAGLAQKAPDRPQIG